MTVRVHVMRLVRSAVLIGFRKLKETFGGLPTPEVKTILAENPARVFGFDLDELSTYADAVGPSIEELESYEPTGKLWRW